MSLFPVVQSPCPYKGPLADIMDGSMCRLCKREVHDLGAMGEHERMALVAGCPDEICVTYKVPASSVIAAMALGAAAVAAPAYAQGADAAPQVEQTQAPAESDEDFVIMVGGLRRPDKAVWQSDRPAAKGRELPVIVEEAPVKPEPKKPSAGPEQT